jgi:hypothetical protein
VTQERRHGPFWIIIGLLALLGLCAAGFGAAGLAARGDRHPTKAEVAAAGQREFAVLWRRLAAGEIFPASVGYYSNMGFDTKAALVGMAPQAGCASAVAPAMARTLTAAGCVTVLRATYTDASRTTVATVGIAVMSTANGAVAVMHVLGVNDQGGLLPVSFPGTIADLFTRAAAETSGVDMFTGPYVFLYVAGYTDGRSTKLEAAPDNGYLGETLTTDLGSGVASSIGEAF